MPCPKLAEGDVVRITRVDNCGKPIPGENNAFVDDCWASVEMAANVEQGTDINFRGMNGRSCGFKRGCPEFRGFDITGQFFTASPEMIELLTGNPVVFDYAGNPIGWDDCQVQCHGGFALEVWQNVIGEECPEDGEAEGLWFLWTLPWITNAILGNLTVNNEGLTFSLTGNTRANGRWGVGPWDVVAQDEANTPGPWLTPIGGEGSECHRRGALVTVPPPEAVCEYLTVPEMESPGLVSV